MEISIKTFSEFTLEELYQVLQLRSEVFVVEQDCVYQDIDGKDQEALHIMGSLKGKIIAYTRCFPPGIYFEEAKNLNRKDLFPPLPRLANCAIRRLRLGYREGY